jgi:hypothetical protein
VPNPSASILNLLMQREYPSDGAALVNPDRKYKADVLRAMKRYRRSKPWQGSSDDQCDKLRTLHEELCHIYGVRLFLCLTVDEERNGSYCPGTRTITLFGARRSGVSVVTYLHEFAHAMFGASERYACTWSINLYARIFPRSFERMEFRGHMLVRRAEA